MATIFLPGGGSELVRRNVVKLDFVPANFTSSSTRIMRLEEGEVLKGSLIKRLQDFNGTSSATIRTVGALGTEGTVVMATDTNIENAVRNADNFPIVADAGGMDVFLDLEGGGPESVTDIFTVDAAAAVAGTPSGLFNILVPINEYPVGTVFSRMKLIQTLQWEPFTLNDKSRVFLQSSNDPARAGLIIQGVVRDTGEEAEFDLLSSPILERTIREPFTRLPTGGANLYLSLSTRALLFTAGLLTVEIDRANDFNVENGGSLKLHIHVDA